jgi:serine/threonine protein phosphatase PrpC
VTAPHPPQSEHALSPGPTVSFGFNLAKIPDHGEDSDPILRDGPDLALLGVFDGMGGAGGTVYDTEDGPRSGAYLAARIARDVVEDRMLDVLVPDWNLNGDAAAEDLRRSVQEALVRRLAELKAPPSRLRSKLLRALPTTMAVVGVQRAGRAGSTWLCHVFWAGDSRAYAFQPNGARQLTVDDLRDSNDAMTNLQRDSVVSNAMSADTDFRVNYRRVELEAPFFLLCATDGCFGYLPTPMHFERLVLRSLAEASSIDAWSRGIQSDVAAVTGDDAAMAVVSVGADLDDLQHLYAPRVGVLEERFTTPIDELGRAVARAEDELTAARQHQLEETQQLWSQYRAGYERYLRTGPPIDEEQERDASHSSSAPESGQADTELAASADSPPETAAAAERPSGVTA